MTPISVLLLSSLSATFMLTSAHKVHEHSDNRIIGGLECVPNSQPWQVNLYYFDQLACGGALINEKWILTAAHCELSNLQIRLGDHNINVYEGKEQFTYADKICPHPGYSGITYDNDIMLLKLPAPVTLNENIQIIPIGCPLPPVGTSCTVSGMGSTTSPEDTYPALLRCLDVETVSDEACRNAYPGEITESMMCAGFKEGEKDACKGDSGGPLVCDSKLSGITSWGNIPCAAVNKPGIYTNICRYQDWIRDTIANDDCLP